NRFVWMNLLSNSKVGSFIAYKPKKPTKWDRVYTMADSNIDCLWYSALLWNFHNRELLRPDLPVSTRISLHLYKMLDKIPGHHMFMDRITQSEMPFNWNDPNKWQIIAKYNKSNKSNKKLKFNKKFTIAYRKDNTLVLAWKDKRIVTSSLTTWDNAGKPNVIINYIKYMGGVNQGDQYASTICLINSYILYKSEKRTLSHLQYIKTLVEQFRGDFHQARDRASTFSFDEVRSNGKLHVILTGIKKGCKICSQRNKPGKKHQTTFYCDFTCSDKPRMHLGDSFIKYHTKQQYRA
ncbi:unnamed protein product, partial [Heterotrigona itama]